MADNTTLSAAVGTGDSIRDVDKGGVKTPVSLLDIGGAGAETLLSSANPMPVSDNGATLSVDDGGGALTVDGTVGISGTIPVSGPLTDTELRASALPVSAASLPLPTGAATQTTLAAVNTATGAQADVEASGDGSIIAILKRLRTLLGSLGLDATIAAVRDRLPSALVGGRMDVNVGNTPAVSQSGTWNVGTVTALTAISNALPAGNNNIGDVDIASLPALPAGSNNIGDVDVLTLPNVTIGAAIPAGTNNIGDVDVLTLPALPSGTNTIGKVGLAPQTAGGLSASKTISAASTNATSVKASAGQLFGWYISNINASPRYLKLYNKASTPTVGTDTPVMTLLIPGNTAGVAGHVEMTNGIDFTTGIAFALTTGAADNDTGAVAANEQIVNLFYK